MAMEFKITHFLRLPRKAGKRAVSEDSEAHENVSSRANLNHKVTEYFPVRRSVRRTKRCVLEEKQRSLESSVLNCVEDGLAVSLYNSLFLRNVKKKKNLQIHSVMQNLP